MIFYLFVVLFLLNRNFNNGDFLGHGFIRAGKRHTGIVKSRFFLDLDRAISRGK